MNLRSETYKIIARHFAETINVQLIFEENACPATDGKTIILPTEMKEELIDITMGALLHETAHIRMTDFSCCERLSPNQKFCHNVLEDIRIDDATYKIYPNARGFQAALIDDTLKTAKKDRLFEQPFVHQVLIGMIFQANGYNVDEIYSKPVAEAVHKLQPYIDKSKGANPHEIETMAKELAKLLMDEAVNQAMQNGQQQQNPKNGQKGNQSQSGGGQGQGSDSGEYEIVPGGSGSGGSGKPMKINIDIDQYRKARQSGLDAEKTIEEKKQEMIEAGNDYNKNVDDYSNLKRKFKLNDTKLSKLKQEKEQAKKDGDKQKEADLDYKIQEKEQELSQIKKDFDKVTNDTREKQQKYNQIKTDISQAKVKKEQSDVDVNKIGERAFSQMPNEAVAILGFEALKDKDFSVPPSPIDEIDTSRSLDDIIQEVLVLKYELMKQNEEGTKLNNHRLSDVYTDFESVFMEDEIEKKKTHVAFIIDGSGSMDGGWGGGQHASRDLAISALKVLCTSLKKAIDNGAPVDFSVYAFGNYVVPMLESSDNYVEKDMNKIYDKARERTGGGTNLYMAVTKINELMSEKEGDDRIAILLTDGEVDDNEITHLENHVQNDKAKFAFIGLNVTEYDGSASWRLFGDYNITDYQNATEILEKSMMTLMV